MVELGLVLSTRIEYFHSIYMIIGEVQRLEDPLDVLPVRLGSAHRVVGLRFQKISVLSTQQCIEFIEISIHLCEAEQLLEVHKRHLVLLVLPELEELTEMFMPTNEFLELREYWFDDGIIVSLHAILFYHFLGVDWPHKHSLMQLQLQ